MTFQVPINFFTDGDRETHEWRNMFNANDVIESGSINFFDILTVDRINEEGVSVIINMSFGRQNGDMMDIETVSFDNIDVIREFVHSIVAAFMSLDPVMRRAADEFRNKIINELGIDDHNNGENEDDK